MKRFYFILVLMAFVFNLTASAQFYVWKDGKVDFSYANSTPDSVTFAAPTQNPDVPITPPDDPIVEPEHPAIENGALQGLFSISANVKVQFSQGNLQYQASSDTWRFAEEQYSIAGEANSAISSTNEGWIDLFGWGTSGWNGSGAKYYEPWETSQSNGYDYGPYKSLTSYDLTGDFANADWGVFNAIANGGDEAGVWRSMTADEWEYLIARRTNATSLYGVAQVAKVNGLVVLPDDWVLPESATFAAGFSSKDGDYASKNSYSAEEWEVMEKAGAVFLPASGIRKGTVITYDYDGAYWSSTLANKSTGEYSYACCFYSMGVTPKNTDLTSKLKTKNCFGMAVRLVKTAK